MAGLGHSTLYLGQAQRSRNVAFGVRGGGRGLCHPHCSVCPPTAAASLRRSERPGRARIGPSDLGRYLPCDMVRRISSYWDLSISPLANRSLTMSRAEGRDRYKRMTRATDEFIRRFLIHVLPDGFHRIRHYGLFASAARADNVARARQLLAAPGAATTIR